MKKTFALGNAALLVAVALISGSAFAADTTPKPELKDVVKWGVWHEGCRIYAGDDSPADPDQVRECLATVYAHNDYAQQRVRSASAAALAAALRSTATEVPSERQFDRFFEWAAMNRGLLPRFEQLANANDFDAVRALFYDTFKQHAEIRNLLAAVSNRELSDLIKELDLADRVRAMRSGD